MFLYSPSYEKMRNYFDIGDLIVYGKWKNLRGRIVAFGTNDKGFPAIEVEPIPKGRKANKIIELFRIRKAEPAERVAALYMESALLDKGGA